MAKDPKKKRNFFKNFKAELKKVIWPTPKQVVNGTIAVITIVLIIAAIVFVLDLTFDLLNTQGLNRIRRRIETTENVDETDNGLDGLPIIEIDPENIEEQEENEENDANDNEANEEVAE
ncbi:MAG: preprotein translocase subunit SecE [Oscillospiraceae bacterium]|nr:preprotein translocase subunit SecE [Oscillospiraceae bacterium]